MTLLLYVHIISQTSGVSLLQAYSTPPFTFLHLLLYKTSRSGSFSFNTPLKFNKLSILRLYQQRFRYNFQ